MFGDDRQKTGEKINHFAKRLMEHLLKNNYFAKNQRNNDHNKKQGNDNAGSCGEIQ